MPRPLRGSPRTGARNQPSLPSGPGLSLRGLADAALCANCRAAGRVSRPSQHEQQSEGPKWRSAPKGRNWRKTLVRAGQNGRPLTPVIQAKSFQCFMCLLVAKFGPAPDVLSRPLLSGRNVLALRRRTPASVATNRLRRGRVGQRWHLWSTRRDDSGRLCYAAAGRIVRRSAWPRRNCRH